MIQKHSTQKIKEILSHNFSGSSDIDTDELAVPSYLHWNPLIRWLMWKRYELISSMARLSPDMNVLEFGCGIGVFLEELTSRCNNVYAIDLFPEYAKILCKELNLKVEFVRQLADIQDASLDVIIAADVLEHLNQNDLLEYLTIFSRKLKSNGRLIVSGPTENFVYKIGRVLAGFAGKGDYHLTNINSLVDEIKIHYKLKLMQGLPFKFPPYLFKICEFENASSQ